MGTISRDQLVKYIKGLEQKVKKYQTELKDRDAEISQLKNKLLKVSGDTEILNKAIAEQSEQKSRDQKARQAEQSQNNQPTETEEKGQIAPKFNVKPKLKTKPLENRPASFVKKAAVGTDDKIKKVVRGEKEEEPAEAKEPVAAPQQEPPEPEEKVEEEQKPPMPSVNFKAGEFVGKVLEGEEQANEMKALLEQLESIDPKEKRNVYMAMTKVYWSMVQSMGKRLVHENLPWEKRLFLRYGMLDDKLMADRMDVWNQLYFDKSKPEDTGIYFLDEWLDDIARGNLKYSQIDEMALDGRKPDPNASGAVALEYELLNIEQMQRMSVGPRANTVTILVQEYCSPGRDNPTVNRAWLKGAMDEIIKCDYKMFERRHKGEDKVVKPLFIICPGYGQRSGCWEPWSQGKKGDTGPRICLCVFPPRSSMKTLLMGVADYRWEFAKADAMHY
ncbi:hypothetical protein GF373_11860, partial [bacterium]|nr:hypothetical protein [bacterium]